MECNENSPRLKPNAWTKRFAKNAPKDGENSAFTWNVSVELIWSEYMVLRLACPNIITEIGADMSHSKWKAFLFLAGTCTQKWHFGWQGFNSAALKTRNRAGQHLPGCVSVMRADCAFGVFYVEWNLALASASNCSTAHLIARVVYVC